MNMIGQQVKRVDAYGKVTGEAKYTADSGTERYISTERLFILLSPTAW